MDITGLAPRFADHIPDAANKLRQEANNILITRYQLPEKYCYKNGFHLMGAIKKNPALNHLPATVTNHIYDLQLLFLINRKLASATAAGDYQVFQKGDMYG